MFNLNQVFLLCVLAISALAQSNHATTVSDSVLHITTSVKSDDHGNFIAPVVNTGTKTITAYTVEGKNWSMAIPCILCVIAPGQTLVSGVSWSAEDSLPKIVSVIFDDGTAVGDQKEIDRIFEWRQGWASEYRALRDLIRVNANSPTFRADAEKILKSRTFELTVASDERDTGKITAIGDVANLIQDNDAPHVLQDLDRSVTMSEHYARRAQ